MTGHDGYGSSADVYAGSVIETMVPMPIPPEMSIDCARLGSIGLEIDHGVPVRFHKEADGLHRRLRT